MEPDRKLSSTAVAKSSRVVAIVRNRYRVKDNDSVLVDLREQVEGIQQALARLLPRRARHTSTAVEEEYEAAFDGAGFDAGGSDEHDEVSLLLGLAAGKLKVGGGVVVDYQQNKKVRAPLR